MWKMGPECAPQQAKYVSASTMNCGERSALAADDSVTSFGAAAARGEAPGACRVRTDSAAGISSTHDTIPIASIAGRHPCVVTRYWASGDIVSGAMPIPAETSETASARRCSNQPMTVAIIGAMKALEENPTSAPYASWNCPSDSARLASVSAAPSSTEPIITTRRTPQRSLAQPQKKEPAPSVRKFRLMALEIPARPQPVSTDIGSRNTASENMAPIATQPIRPPSATSTQPYLDSIV